ncbi:hypothetical protein [Planomonospora venezuelensis]|uniref:Uncharacterized protein n=1 Tax=Planomonospora venezuelensis TaxID=1999 RepID=A0A841D351_PLAVE|nr:hypothetical protein [Planomonospora venezuelensis]MBB5962934.1 hypothetical protein [Planomonospora venezuelensis]GIN04551.1 hypothetical protein Pve01_62090 [Planomonospora venezuelensis]
MSQTGRSQEPERRPESSSARARGGWPPAGSRIARGAAGRRGPLPEGSPAGGAGAAGSGSGDSGAHDSGAGPPRRTPAPRPAARRARVRPWSATVRDRLAAERAGAVALERGIRFRAVFLLLMGTILAVAAADVLSGTVGLLSETAARPLTAAEQNRYVQEDVARRWRTWPASLVFPRELEYIGLARTQQYAQRVGIAPETACRSGTDAAVGSVLAQHGCRTLLRATYVDQTSTFAITVGVAVMDDAEKRRAATAELPVDDRVGVRPVAFPGTATDLFGAAQRQRNAWIGVGPYIVFSTAGYTDGRTRASIAPEEIPHSELWPAAQAVAGRIAHALGAEPAVPRCTQGNAC